MDGFGLLVGHLLGDYVLQNDWQAANKVNAHPGPNPDPEYRLLGVHEAAHGLTDGERATCVKAAEWNLKAAAYRTGHLACTVHCTLYTLAVWLCSCWWMPWWGLVVCFLAHWPIDRFRLARLWMVHISGQRAFATGPLSPWSIIVVDNVFHLLTLFLIGVGAGLR